MATIDPKELLMDDINWGDYMTYTDEWRDTRLEHDVKGCRAVMTLFWQDVGSIIDEVKAHHVKCPLNS